MAKRSLISHAGLAVAALALVLLIRFPLNPNEALPNALETLFDWAGENAAIVWIGSAVFASNFGLAFLLAGVLDRCPMWHGLIAISLFCVGYNVLYLSSYALALRIIVALLTIIYFSVGYTAVRLATNHLTMRWSQRPPVVRSHFS
jgi:hypothetical protein